MNRADEEFSTQKISPQLVSQILEAVKNKAYGSVEIYVENFNVVQITERTITKVRKTKLAKRQNIRNLSSRYQSRNNN